MPEDTKSDVTISKRETKRPSPLASPITNDDIKKDLTSPLIVKTHSVTPPPFKSESEEPATPATPARPTKAAKVAPQLIGHLPRAETEALRAFVEISDNHYQYGTLGRSREALESMLCDCQFDPENDDTRDACGKECINRLTQVECLEDECRCRSYCQNQRFRLKDYANIEIVQTEKKGFGLRAGEDLPKDTFVYEYVGDVINEISFKKRMRDYAEEGIRHFYFMMLQKGEFIDATKRGGIGRFANHSCNPNCYVAKWTVGSHVRMGIFTSRLIHKNEELTFNYNVDRYGHDAQPCYCGEAKCVGYIGGKTQTDIAAMDDLYLDALGITDEVELLGLKGTKKKKSKKLDEDFVPIMKPIVEKDVPKVVQAMRQTQSRKVLLKLLTRVKITEDQSALRQIMRLRGFSVMTNLLEDYAQDLELVVLTLECMMTWPLIQRNKVEDSKVNVPVQAFSKSENEILKSLAEKLLSQWAALEYAYRIPKRMKLQDEEDEEPRRIEPPVIEPTYSYEIPPWKRKRYEEDRLYLPKLALKPVPLPTPVTPPTPPPIPASVPRFSVPPPQSRVDVAAIIAAAAAAAAAETEAAAKAAAPDPRKQEKRKSSKTNGSSSKTQTKEDKEANKEKRLLKLVGAVVVKCMSKYQKQMDHELFKKHAKELTHIITEKEKKSSSYQAGKLDSLSDEKVVKIKKFAKEYIAKILRKMEKSNRKPRHPETEASTSTPDSNEGNRRDSAGMRELTLEDMGMDLDEDGVHGDGDEHDADGDALEDDDASGSSPPKPPDSMDVDTSASPTTTPVADPRPRPLTLAERIGGYAWEYRGKLPAETTVTM